MTKNPRFVPAVPGLCRALCRDFRSCAGCAGSITHARTRTKTTAPTSHKRAHMRICTRHTRHTRHMLDSYTFFRTTPGTHAGTPGTDTLACAPNPFIHLFESKKMGETAKESQPAAAPLATRTIRCTPDNAREMQQVVKNWPELHALVQSLQEQDMFPGLRGLSITLTGPESFVGKGLGALIPENAPKRD